MVRCPNCRCTALPPRRGLSRALPRSTCGPCGDPARAERPHSGRRWPLLQLEPALTPRGAEVFFSRQLTGESVQEKGLEAREQPVHAQAGRQHGAEAHVQLGCLEERQVELLWVSA